MKFTTEPAPQSSDPLLPAAIVRKQGDPEQPVILTDLLHSIVIIQLILARILGKGSPNSFVFKLQLNCALTELACRFAISFSYLTCWVSGLPLGARQHRCRFFDSHSTLGPES